MCVRMALCFSSNVYMLARMPQKEIRWVKMGLYVKTLRENPTGHVQSMLYWLIRLRDTAPNHALMKHTIAS